MRRSRPAPAIPTREGYVERDGVRIFYERLRRGRADRAAAADVVDRALPLLEGPDPLPRAPLPGGHLRRARQRPLRPAGGRRGIPRPTSSPQDTLAVMDATGTERASLVALSCGALWATILAAEHPERVDAIVYIGPALRARAAACPSASEHAFDEPLDTDEGWAKYNSHYWRGTTAASSSSSSRSASTSPIRPSRSRTRVAWALDTDPEALADTTRGIGLPTREDRCTRRVRASPARRS